MKTGLLIVIIIVQLIMAWTLDNQLWEMKMLLSSQHTSLAGITRSGGPANHPTRGTTNTITGKFFFEDSYPDGITIDVNGYTVEGVTHINLYGRIYNEELEQ